MKITLNPDAEIVKVVKEGLRRTGGYCPCRTEKKKIINVCAGNSGSRSRTRDLKVTVTACFITRQRRKYNDG